MGNYQIGTIRPFYCGPEDIDESGGVMSERTETHTVKDETTYKPSDAPEPAEPNPDQTEIEQPTEEEDSTEDED